MSRKFTATGLEKYEILPDGKMYIYAEEMGDDYHTIHELYQHRMALNIALFNEWARLRDVGGIWEVMKSKLHYDGTMFEGGYFIVMAIHPAKGQFSYHYTLKHWDKFDIPEVERTPKYDGHTPESTIEKLINS